ncbi:nuclear receptor coactivator 5 [Hydra vulgaris]|uniref:Nuclear receptor coactivator 5 n=1 Tax=Hydra vulgaris TaxID=6087 RepID=T2M521_HYDVU|nr:nuclear receptor coactivator 5 [Hydra vulgaris]XP_047128996.1 nuclear receptor coactivator 5 [Hydra vulgaris]XP_047129051.1 nuclear receptor coactivator 5 [Hydra vulgaris]XP_047129152.1 nuclear receptor coactivator 5 [Hydra vulgaris]
MSESDSKNRDRSRSPLNRGVRNLGRDTNSNDTNAVRRRVFVGNLAVDKASKREVEEIFIKFGAIESISLHNNYGFIQFCDEAAADEAVLNMHGKEMFGKRIDVNLAGLRRKTQAKDKFEGPLKKEEVVPPHMMNAGAGIRPTRPRRPQSRSPVRKSPNRDDGYGRSLSPMSRYEELYRREDSYSRPEPFLRAPFDPYERPHYGGRDYPIPQDRDVYRRDYPPPYERDYLSRDVSYRRPEFRPPPQRVRPAIDCEVISLSKEESRYAEEVESRLRSIGLVCNIGYPPPDVTPADAVDRVARLGTLYAVVVAPQNAIHRSCTLNILHGTRQEHRNMPLDDCLSLVARNFDMYLSFLREPYRGPPPPAYGARDDPRAYAPHSAYDLPAPPPHNHVGVGIPTKEMSTQEIEEMIEKLRREKEQRESQASKDTEPQRRAELDGQLRNSRQDTNGKPGYINDNQGYANNQGYGHSSNEYSNYHHATQGNAGNYYSQQSYNQSGYQ